MAVKYATLVLKELIIYHRKKIAKLAFWTSSESLSSDGPLQNLSSATELSTLFNHQQKAYPESEFPQDSSINLPS